MSTACPFRRRLGHSRSRRRTILAPGPELGCRPPGRTRAPRALRARRSERDEGQDRKQGRDEERRDDRMQDLSREDRRNEVTDHATTDSHGAMADSFADRNRQHTTASAPKPDRKPDRRTQDRAGQSKAVGIRATFQAASRANESLVTLPILCSPVVVVPARRAAELPNHFRHVARLVHLHSRVMAIVSC